MPLLFIIMPHSVPLFSLAFSAFLSRKTINQIEMGTESDFDGCISHGPWGGSEGNKWVYMPDRGSTKKIQIIVRYDSVVRSIELQSYCSNGEVKSYVFGDRRNGSQIGYICIDNTKEYLISLSVTCGSYDRYNNEVVVKTICFMTNLNLHGPYGGHVGDHAFSHDFKDELVVGFHGRTSGDYLNAIGVYVIPKPLALGQDSSELSSSVSRMVMPRDVGPWGAVGGMSWDDGVFSTIKKVRVYVGRLNVIYALQFAYQKRDGNSVLSQIHGETDGLEMQLVNLDDNDEHLTGISGFCGPVMGYNGLEAIGSISFHTNKRIHGPYGEVKGVGYFCSTPSPGKVVGFHGRNNGFLSAIGVHMEYF